MVVKCSLELGALRRRACSFWLWTGSLVWGCQLTGEPGAVGEPCNDQGGEQCVADATCIATPGEPPICHALCRIGGDDCGPEEGQCTVYTLVQTNEQILACEYTWSTPSSVRPGMIGGACNYESDSYCSDGGVCADGICRERCVSEADCSGAADRCIEVAAGISLCVGPELLPGPVPPGGGGNDTDSEGSGGVTTPTTVAVPEWIRQFGNPSGETLGYSEGRDVRVTRDGGIVVVGQQSDGRSYEDDRLAGAYVRKYSRLGELEWSESFGFSGDSAWAVDEDPSGNIVIAGATTGLVTPLGGIDAAVGTPYVRKYDATGNVLWTRQFETNFAYGSYAVSADAAGNVIVVGDRQVTVTDPDGLYVRKYDPAGNELWTRQFASALIYGDVAADSSGNILVAGGIIDPSANNRREALVRKYDPTGNVLWTQQFGTLDALAEGIAVDRADNIIVAGVVSGALPGQVNSGDSGSDAYVRKYDPAGNELWTRQFGSPGGEDARDVSVDVSGNIVVAGSTGGALPQASGDGGAYLRKYDPDGSVLWTQQFGNSTSTYVRAASLYDDGRVVVVGQTQETLPGVQKPADLTNSFVIAFVEMSSVGPGGGNDGSGGGTNAGSTPGVCSVAAPPYPGQAECRNLLDEYVGQVQECTCPATLTAMQDTYEPPIAIGTCTRDTYVSAALLYCWAAECYSLLGVTQAQVDAGLASFTPASAAAAAIDQLANADALCSDAPVLGAPQMCPTLDLYDCDCVRGVCQ